LSTGPPASRDKRPQDGQGGGAHNVNIENFHYTASDIDALTRMAKVNPGLATAIVQQRDTENRREHVSYRFGLVSSAILVSSAAGACLVGLIIVGLFQTLVLVAVILAVAMLVRVVLTGEWSETSWFGWLVHLLARALGSRSASDDETGKQP
jgi:hypothetical protein